MGLACGRGEQSQQSRDGDENESSRPDWRTTWPAWGASRPRWNAAGGARSNGVAGNGGAGSEVAGSA